MTPEQFAYWLNGFVELNGGMVSDDQWISIKQHLATVFKKVTPAMPAPSAAPNYPDVLKDWIEKAQREHRTVPSAPLWPHQWPTNYPITC
jgi:hypothetical protein